LAQRPGRQSIARVNTFALMADSGWIAIIDDDPSVSMALTRTLRVRGLRSKSYASAKEFLSETADPPRCLIVDLQMPGMTGLELLQHLQDTGKSIPAIVVTAHGDATTRQHCEAAGAVAFLTKPWRNASLLAAIDTASAMRPPL
jgi:FixJ family two-component response regulator